MSDFSLFQKYLTKISLFFYPPKCLKCNVHIDMKNPFSMFSFFCECCMKEGFYKITLPFCLKCGTKRYFDEFDIFDHKVDAICKNCLKKSLKVDRVRAALEYKGITKDAITLFKYHSKISLSKVFEILLFQSFVEHYSKLPIDLIVPVPLHKTKLKKRGFNQSYILIRNFVKLYKKTFYKFPDWKIDPFALVRIKKTKPQTGFNSEQRQENVFNVFEVKNKEVIKGKHILLIDDVFTTGSTCSAVAKELLDNKAKKVYALVLASV